MQKTKLKTLLCSVCFIILIPNINTYALNPTPRFQLSNSKSFSDYTQKKTELINLHLRPTDAAYEAGTLIIAASLFTAIVFAPLVSTNLKTGNVNFPRMYKWIGIGIAGVGVGIPITFAGRGDTKRRRNK